MAVDSSQQDMAALGDRLKSLREVRKFSQQAVASDLAVGRSTLSAWERGTRALPVESLVQLASYYGVCPCELLLPLCHARDQQPQQALLLRVATSPGQEFEMPTPAAICRTRRSSIHAHCNGDEVCSEPSGQTELPAPDSATETCPGRALG